MASVMSAVWAMNPLSQASDIASNSCPFSQLCSPQLVCIRDMGGRGGAWGRGRGMGGGEGEGAMGGGMGEA